MLPGDDDFDTLPVNQPRFAQRLKAAVNREADRPAPHQVVLLRDRQIEEPRWPPRWLCTLGWLVTNVAKFIVWTVAAAIIFATLSHSATLLSSRFCCGRRCRHFPQLRRGVLLSKLAGFTAYCGAFFASSQGRSSHRPVLSSPLVCHAYLHISACCDPLDLRSAKLSLQQLEVREVLLDVTTR